ncbi:unnamed protein product, partial [Staurois parvus]
MARTQGPHDPLLPGGPMSCQSAPGKNERKSHILGCHQNCNRWEIFKMGTLVVVTLIISLWGDFLSLPVLAMGQEVKGNLP